MCSFENDPKLHISKLISKKVGAPFFYGDRRMSATEMEAAFSWVDDHFLFLHQENGDLADIDSIIDRFKAAVLRYGIRGVLLDPYNFISRPREMSGTDWVSVMMTKLKVFAMAHGVHVWLVAHPTKIQRGQDGKYMVPKGYEIADSAHFFNKTDNGITVHRDKDEDPYVQIHIWKMRHSWLGRQGECRLIYDKHSTRYIEPAQQPEGDLL